MSAILNLIGRKSELFHSDIQIKEKKIKEIIINSSFLVIGGAGSIGSAVVKEIFKRNPKKLHVVDISENNLAELVRDIRSSFGYICGEFKTFSLACGFNASVVAMIPAAIPSTHRIIGVLPFSVSLIN